MRLYHSGRALLDEVSGERRCCRCRYPMLWGCSWVSSWSCLTLDHDHVWYHTCICLTLYHVMIIYWHCITLMSSVSYLIIYFNSHLMWCHMRISYIYAKSQIFGYIIYLLHTTIPPIAYYVWCVSSRILCSQHNYIMLRNTILCSSHMLTLVKHLDALFIRNLPPCHPFHIISCIVS